MRRAFQLSWLLAAAWSGAASAGDGAPVFADGFEACCTVGGTVSGLAGRGLTLRLAAGALNEDRAIAADGAFTFAAALAPGVEWTVGVQTQPSSGPPCLPSNASGTMGSVPVIDVAVHCAASLHWDSGKWGDLWQ
jgi:hypothetical protein